MYVDNSICVRPTIQGQIICTVRIFKENKMNALEVQTVHNYAYVLVSDEEASWTVFCGFSLNCRSYILCDVSTILP